MPKQFYSESVVFYFTVVSMLLVCSVLLSDCPHTGAPATLIRCVAFAWWFLPQVAACVVRVRSDRRGRGCAWCCARGLLSLSHALLRVVGGGVLALPWRHCGQDLVESSSKLSSCHQGPGALALIQGCCRLVLYVVCMVARRCGLCNVEERGGYLCAWCG